MITPLGRFVPGAVTDVPVLVRDTYHARGWVAPFPIRSEPWILIPWKEEVQRGAN